MPKHRTPSEEYLNEQIRIVEKTAKMDSELVKYGHKTTCGGTAWTVGDMQRYFRDLDKRKRRRK